MGGHGGLNILPQVCFHSQHTIAEREHHKDSNQQQKSWHVYGRENRNKVARDEAKHAEEQKAQDEKHQQAEREFKRSLLLSRAQAKYGVGCLLPSLCHRMYVRRHSLLTICSPHTD